MKYSFEQLAVTQHRDGHALVSASPGSGKTTTLARLVTSLLEDDVMPQHMLILMFNRDAKDHFANKLRQLTADMPNVHSIPEVKTYHSLGMSITKAMVQKGFLPNYRLETSTKRQEVIGLNVIRNLVNPTKLKELQNKNSKIVDVFISFTEMTKSMMLPPSEVFDALDIDKELRFFIDGFDKFEEARKKEKVRFFTDLIYDPLMAIRANPQLKDWLSNKKAYVICDEFQDSDPMQYELLEVIAGSTANVIACGDIDQSIYTFRGADPELMMHQFSKSFPDPIVYNLSQTYRYGDELAMSANNLIQHNNCRYDNLCVSNENNAETSLDIEMSPQSYGQTASDIVLDLMSQDVPLSDIAVLVRLYSVAIPIELAFLQNGISVNMDRGRSCFNSSEFKAMENLLKLSLGSTQAYTPLEKSEVYASLLKFPHTSLSATTVESMLKHVEKHDCSYSECLKFGLSSSADLHPFVKKKLRDCIELVESIERQAQQPRSRKLSSHTLLSKYAKDTELSSGLAYSALSDQEMQEMNERNVAFMKFFKTNDQSPESMINMLSGLKDVSREQSNATNSVIITSVHKAKGLEWPYVIVPGIECGKWPYESSNGTTDIESERRLLYVAITRAMKKTFALTPKDRNLVTYIATGRKPNMKFLLPGTASKFLYELDVFETKQWINSGTKSSRTPLFKRYIKEKHDLCV